MYNFRKKAASAALVAAAALMMTSCAGETAEDEIKVPIYDSEANYSTKTVEYADLSASASTGASIGYVFAQNLKTSKSSNLISINVSKFTRVKKGDILATFETSAMDYQYLEQQIRTESALEAYQEQGGEKLRLEYEEQKAELDAIEYEISTYNITAPFDGIITDIASIETGSEVNAGSYVCSIAHEDEIYVYLSEDTDYYKIGMNVKVKLTGKSYDATVLSVPTGKASSGGGNNWGGGGNGGSSGNRVSCSSNVIIGFTPEILAEVLEETPNAVNAGWATVSVTTAEKTHVLAVPSAAVKLYSGSVYVNQLIDGQKLQTPVETGETISGSTVILSGLSEGDVIIMD